MIERVEATDNSNAKIQVPPIVEALDYHGAAIERLAIKVEKLEHRLTPILSPTDVEKSVAGGNDAKASSQVLTTINNFSDAIEGLTGRLDTILSQLDI